MSNDTFPATTVQSYIDEGLHSRRGMTEGEYRLKCQELWDGCKEEDGGIKLLIDHLMPLEKQLDKERYYYIDEVNPNYNEGTPESKPLECVLLFFTKFGKDGKLVTKDNPYPKEAGFQELNEDPMEPKEMPYIIGFFDVLGFSDLHSKLGTTPLLEKYQNLLDKVTSKQNLRTFQNSDVIGVHGSMVGSLPVRYAYFSDTIILWTPLVAKFAAPFAARCSDMIIESLLDDMPLRGSITIGYAVMNKPKSVYLGEPIIEAAELEKSQNWIGVSYGVSALMKDFQIALGWRNVRHHYTKHFKPNSDNLISELVLDWTHRMKDRYNSEEVIAKIQELKAKTAKTIYYDNTLEFIEHCLSNANWWIEQNKKGT
jgi:hypothetical protein